MEGRFNVMAGIAGQAERVLFLNSEGLIGGEMAGGMAPVRPGRPKY